MQWYHVTFLLVWPHLLRQGERTSYHKWLMCHTPIKNKRYKNDAATDRFSFTTYTKHLQRKLWLAFLFNTQGFILLENFLFFKEYFLWMQFIDVQSGRKWRTASNPGKNVSVFAETTENNWISHNADVKDVDNNSNSLWSNSNDSRERHLFCTCHVPLCLKPVTSRTEVLRPFHVVNERT